MEVLKFKNIEEIKFTKVGENTYSISIKSDILNQDKHIKNTMFESNLCVIDSSLTLTCHDEYSCYNIGGIEGMGKSYSIPMNIQLLVDKKSNDIFRITKER